MFYWNQEEVTHCGQSQVEGNGSLALVRDTCQKSWKAHTAWKEMWFFFFLFFSLRWMMDSSTAAMAARAAPINSASLPSHTYWTVTDSPIQDPSGSWKVQLTANSRTFSNRCCRASFTLKSLTLGAAFTAALSPLLRAAFGKQPDRFYAVAQYDEMALNNNRYSI